MVLVEFTDLTGDFFTFFGLVVAIISAHLGYKSYKDSVKKNDISWDELKKESRNLKFDIDSYGPDIIFAPCKRGATIVNLMYDVDENIMTYIGIRIEKKGKQKDGQGRPLINLIDKDRIVKTNKYCHCIPKDLLEIENKKEFNLLIVDDFAKTGDSLENIVNFLKSKGFENIKSAAMVCSKTAIKGNKSPDYYRKEIDSTEFDFPWGKAI